jgi:Matrixin
MRREEHLTCRIPLGWLVRVVAIVAFIAWNTQPLAAYHRSGHDPDPEDGGAQTVTIDLLNCDDGTLAKWSAHRITFQIVDVSGVGAAVVQAVRDGVLRWNSVQNVYDLQESTSGTADITIRLFFKIVPGYILGVATVNCPENSDIQSVEILLGVRGLNLIGVANLAAHEVGHGLGLGHASRTGDLMDPQFERRTEAKRTVCPSNLDVGGLSATTDPYSILTQAWQELPCQ